MRNSGGLYGLDVLRPASMLVAAAILFASQAGSAGSIPVIGSTGKICSVTCGASPKREVPRSPVSGGHCSRNCSRRRPAGLVLAAPFASVVIPAPVGLR